MDIQEAVRNAYYSAQESAKTEIPNIGEVWNWLPTIDPSRIMAVLNELGFKFDVKPSVKKTLDTKTMLL
jgi:hypothetical protein